MLRAECMAAALGALVALGCGDDGVTPDVDAEVDDDGGAGSIDAPVGSGGLRVEFKSQPKLPGDAGGPFDVKIDRVELYLENVRAIGDAAPGDERTRVDAMTLRWADAEVEAVSFADAPPGIYSRVTGGIAQYELYGSAMLASGRTPFEVEDEHLVGLAFTVDLVGVSLEAGASETVEIDVVLDAVVSEIDWDSVPIEEGRLKLEGEDGDMDAVRARLQAGFQQHD